MDENTNISFRVKVISNKGQELTPTTPQRARRMIKTGVALGRRDKSTQEFYIEMKADVRNCKPATTT